LKIKARQVWRAITPVGRAVLGVAIVTWLLGIRLGWQELFLVAACCALLLILAITFVIGTPSLGISIDLDPPRVTAGGKAAGRLAAVNRSRRRVRQLAVELPVGKARLLCDLPSLARGANCEVRFDIPAERRAVIRVGPASAVRTDPLGLLRRDASASRDTELFVHPRVIALDSLSPGLQRDLEGQATRDLSTSDLAFHALRDYLPGDDRRHVHWRSSARAGRLLVRQFQDTRRSQLTLLVDGAAASYRTADEFELALSVAGSIGLRAVTDQQDVYLVAASHAVHAARRERVLDTLARAELGESGQDLASLAARAARAALDTTVLMLLTGSVVPFRSLKAAAVYFGPDVRVLALRAEPDAPPGITRSADITVFGLRALGDLPGLIAAGEA
jgi:uncharacterized protein (DUF58 family)